MSAATIRKSPPRLAQPHHETDSSSRPAASARHPHPSSLRRLPFVDPPPRRARAIRSLGHGHPHHGPRALARSGCTAHSRGQKGKGEARGAAPLRVSRNPPLPYTGRPSARAPVSLAASTWNSLRLMPPTHAKQVFWPHSLAVALRHRLCGHAVLLHPLGRRSQIHRARTLDGPGARPLAALRRNPHLLKPLPSCSCSRPCGSAQPKAGGARSRSPPPASRVPVWCF
jgi:hypothetical protein